MRTENLNTLTASELDRFLKLVFKISATIQVLSESFDEMDKYGYKKEIKLNQSIKHTQLHLHNGFARAMKAMPERSELLHYENVKNLEKLFVDFVEANLQVKDGFDKKDKKDAVDNMVDQINK